MMNPRAGVFMLVMVVALVNAACVAPPVAPPAASNARPNVLWITLEDWSPDLSCYGTAGIHTPHVDKLASEGVRYERAFTTSPVCSTSRSAMMTGFHQNYIRANQHRLRSEQKQPLPHGVRPIPHLFRDAGYFTGLMSWKTDCNFVPFKRGDLFEGEDWSERAEGQPFFVRITFGETHRSWSRDPIRPIATTDVELPPYYADTEFVRRDWANGLEQMQAVDRKIGALLQRLDDEGIADNTVVVLIGDHGRCHIRGKQFLYDGGIRIPMIVRWPGRVEPGRVSDEMVMSIDLCATLLDAAGIAPQVPLHGKNLFGPEVASRRYVFAARDRMDQTHDAMRAVRSADHKLIVNLMPERPYLQFNSYKEGAYPVLAEMNAMHLRGELTPRQARFFAPRKPPVELYDLRRDPYELVNLADDPAYAGVKAELMGELAAWRDEVIEDAGVSEDFRAAGVFPDVCPTPTVDGWIAAQGDAYDFDRHGWPAWYPTRTLAEWERVRAVWQEYVFREPGDAMKAPRDQIVHARKKARPREKKKPAAAAE